MDKKIRIELLFYALIIALFLMQVIIILKSNSVGWDESVYIGIGKYMFSGGSSGLWEVMRPPLIPVIAGILWKLKLDPVLYGRLFSSLLSIGTVILTYAAAKKISGQKEAVLAAILLASSPIFIEYSYFFQTDISSTFLALASLYIFISRPRSSKNLFFAGLFAGMAFLARFPQAAILAVILISLAIEIRPVDKKRAIEFLKKASFVLIGFLILAVPYFAFNYIKYGAAIQPMITAQLIEFELTGNYNWMYYLGYSYYFTHLAEQNFLSILWLAGAVLAISAKKYKDKSFVPVLLASTLFMAYFTIMPLKELRFIIVALPYMAITGAYLFREISRKMGVSLEKITVALAILLVLAAYHSISWMIPASGQISDIQPEKAMAGVIMSSEGNLPIYTSSPFIATYVDNPIFPNYHTMDYFVERFNYINKSYYVATSTCSFPCPENDSSCKAHMGEKIGEIAAKSRLVWAGEKKGCEYFLFIKQNSTI